jgi:hypothetical protein
MQDRRGSMADNGPIVQLRDCGQDQLAMLIGTRALRWSIAYIGTPAHRDQATVTLHPSQVAPVVALVPQSPSEHDVVHAAPLNAASYCLGTWSSHICG